MIARFAAQTIVIWAVVFVGLLLVQHAQSAGLTILVETITGRDLGLTFSASAAAGLLGFRKAAVPLLLAILLFQYPSWAITDDLARALAPLGLGLLIGSYLRTITVDGKWRANASDQRANESNNTQ